ncbi:MAG: acyl carrier protein [Smithella sp.]
MMEEILQILSEIRPEFDFMKSSNFIEDGLLDSFDIVTLVSSLDRKYSISIDGVDILPENFFNLESIESLLFKYGVKI